MLDTGGRGGFDNESLEGFLASNWSRDAEARRRVFRPWLRLELWSWSLDAEARSLGFLNSPAGSVTERLEPDRLSLDGDGRIIELGRGMVEVGLGMPETGRGTGSLDGRGMPLARFGVPSMLKKRETVGHQRNAIVQLDDLLLGTRRGARSVARGA